MTQDEECPFTYAPGEEPPKPNHPTIGACALCFGEAKTADEHGKPLCFPCAYSIAN